MGLATGEGKEICVTVKGSGTGTTRNFGGRGRESGRSSEKRKRLRIEIPNGQAIRTQPICLVNMYVLHCIKFSETFPVKLKPQA